MFDINYNDHDAILVGISKMMPEKVKKLLDQPCRIDGNQVFIGDPAAVIVQIDDDWLTLCEFSIKWTGPHTREVLPIPLAKLNWKLMSINELRGIYSHIFSSILIKRREKYRTCEKCMETKPPEWMCGDKICDECAQKYHGIIH